MWGYAACLLIGISIGTFLMLAKLKSEWIERKVHRLEDKKGGGK